MNKDAVIKLSKILQETTGVSLLPLNRQEITSKIMSLIYFPNYIYRTVLIPVGVFLGIVMLGTIGFCLVDNYVFGLIFFTLGGMIGILCGLLLGGILFVNRLSNEIQVIFAEVLKQVRLLLLEMGVADEDMIDGYMEIPPLTEIIKATTFMVAISSVEKTIEKRVPYFPSLVFALIEKLFESLFNSMEGYINNVNIIHNHALQPRATGISSSLQEYSKVGIANIDRLIRERKQLVSRAIRWINVPLKAILLTISGVSLLLFTVLYLLAN